jgi:predicted RNA-binding protein (virulence factor B family)
VHNDGFEYAEPSATNADYQKVLQYLSSKENKIPLLTESTAKSVRGFYNSGKSTNKVVINKITGAAENSVF